LAYASIKPYTGQTPASRSAGRVLARAAALMCERAPRLAELITLEMGKPLAQSQGEVARSAASLDYQAEHAEAFLAPETLATPKGGAEVARHPLGLLLTAADRPQ
jgi:succinate-semialdehyde dehydrogenase / glutarate-semialdehyde dehydrogenase